MKTDKRKKGSFLSLIIRNYLWFSFAVLLALMCIVVVINWMGEQHFSGLKTKKLKNLRNIWKRGIMKNFHLIFCWDKKEHLLFWMKIFK